ncbi:hypothetical protein ACI5KX_10225 [Erythrobacter sp. GH1-10]|uniref:hypothetical protein n=1 Tax=Erythrobacter sp. GH1-10 TaxID=3349334 RepID=UPI0038779B52
MTIITRNLVRKSDGGRRYEECIEKRTVAESRVKDVEVTESAGTVEGVRMCQKYILRGQQQARSCLVFECAEYVAVADSGWLTFRNVLIGLGIIGAIVLTGGGAAVVLGVGGGMAGAAGTAIAVGAGVSTVGLGGGALIEDEDVNDYKKGDELERYETKKCREFANIGQPTSREAVGGPFPCE